VTSNFDPTDEAEKLASRIVILARGSIVADGSPKELTRQVAGQDEVRWTEHGVPHTCSVADSTGFIRELFQRGGDTIRDLDLRRASLEVAYLTLVREVEAEPIMSKGAAA
jgi:ABC-2 type transport system ATP-binding protein